MNLATRVVVLLSLATTTAHADDFSDFRIPDHSAHLLSGSLNGSMSRGESDRPWGTSLREDYSGRTSARWVSLHETDPALLAWGLSMSSNESRNAGHSHEQLSGGAGVDDRASNTEAVESSFGLDLSWRRYPWRLPIGVQFSAFGGAFIAHVWNREHQSSTITDSVTTSTTTSDSRHDQGSGATARGSAMVGIGRVRDVSGVYLARLLAHRLESSRLLTRPPSSGTLRKLASLFYAQPDFFLVHDRASKFFWLEVERILREDGALTGSLDAYSLLRILESPSLLGPFYRTSGFFVGVTSSALHAHSFRHGAFSHRSSSSVDGGAPSIVEGRSAFGFSAESNHAQVGPEAEFHRPIGVRWQIDATSQVLFDVPNDPIRNGMHAQTFVSGTWVFADRWYLVSSMFHQRITLTTATGNESIWAVDLDAALGFQVEDRLRIELSAYQRQGRTGGTFFYPGFERRGEVRIGLSYDFAGSLFAPGLVARQGLTPGSIGP